LFLFISFISFSLFISFISLILFIYFFIINLFTLIIDSIFLLLYSLFI